MATIDIVQSPSAQAKQVPSHDRACIRQLDSLFKLISIRLDLCITRNAKDGYEKITGHLPSQSIDYIEDEATMCLHDLKDTRHIAEALLAESERSHHIPKVILKVIQETLHNIGAMMNICERTADIESVCSWQNEIYQLRMKFLVTVLKMAECRSKNQQTAHDRCFTDGVQ